MLLALFPLVAVGQESGDPLADPPDPFADPADPADPFADPADPFADPADPAPTATPRFDPDAVKAAPLPSGFELHGRANLTAAFIDEASRTEVLDDATSFHLSTADLYAQWFPLTWFGLLGELELESDLQEDDREIELEIELLVAEFRPFEDERLKLRLGHSPVPFGIERRYYAPPRNELANRPAAFRRVYPGTYSDTGVFVWWTLDQGLWGGFLELEAGLTRGLKGPDRGDELDFGRKDNNGEPQITLRLGWTLIDVDPKQKGVTGIAKRLPGRLRFAVGGSGLFGHFDDDTRRRIRYYGLDAELELGLLDDCFLRVRFEYVGSDVETEVPNARARRGVGLYALAAFHARIGRLFLEEVYVAFRYGLADRDQRVDEDLDVERYHFGVGWKPHNHLLVKAGYEFGSEGRDRPDVFLVEVGVAF